MDSFECVLAIAEYRNVTRVAEHLFMTQPALTVRINRLEAQLGIRIFDRSKSPITITPEGNIYIREMTKIRIEEEKLKNTLNQMKSSKEDRNIRIGIGFNRGVIWLPALLSFAQERTPDLRITVFELPDMDIENALLNKELDVGIMGSSPLSPALYSMSIGHQTLFFGIPADSEISGKIIKSGSDGREASVYTINPSDLDGQTFIMGRDGYGFTRYANFIFQAFHITPKSILNVGNIFTSYHLSARNLGISLLTKDIPASVVLNEPEKEPYLCSITSAPLIRSVNFVCRQADVSDPYVLEASKLLKLCYKQLSES